MKTKIHSRTYWLSPRSDHSSQSLDPLRLSLRASAGQQASQAMLVRLSLGIWALNDDDDGTMTTTYYTFISYTLLAHSSSFLWI